MNDKVRAHPVVKLVRQHGGFEASVVWDRDGVRCKARLDKYITEANCPNTIVDLKKTLLGGSSEDKFAKAMVDYNYHCKAAWYADAAVAMDGIEPCFIWVCIEEKPPYCVNVIQCDQESLAIGRYDNQQLFERYRLAMETGKWPGYATDIHLGGVPDWLRRSYQGLLE
jgi:hypothetical protein